MLIDTHAHLYWESFQDDLNQVIQRAIDAGVNTIINVGVDVEKSKIALKQAQEKLSKKSCFSAYSTIGIHPHESFKYPNGVSIHKDILELEKLYQSSVNKIIAVGECGLDYKDIDEQNKKMQRPLFQAQIDLAKKLNLPLIVHCRDDRSKDPQNSEAWDEVLKMVGNHPAILHCYSGLSHTTNYILHNASLIVSFAGTVTYPKNEYLREAARMLPLDRIVLETDCPFLPPQSIRGRRNEPASVLGIAKLITDLKGVSLEEVSIQTTANAKRILGI